jgi:hypothetical protein
MTVHQADALPKAHPWPAYCQACGQWVATVPPGAAWVQAKCQNWRVNRQVAPSRRCPRYGEMQTIKRE